MRWSLSKSEPFEREFKFSGSLDIQAAQAAEGEEPKLPTFSMVANSGEPMLPRGFTTPVVVDLAGVEFFKSPTPVIADHDPTKRVGHTTKQWVNAQGIFAEGVVSSTSSIAQELIADSKNGYPMEVSIGAKILKGRRIEAGKSAVINGKTWNGPLIHAQKTLIRELTATTLGADGKTELSIAASQGAEAIPMKEEFKQWLIAMALDPETLSDDARTKLEAQFDKLSKIEATKGAGTATLEATDEIQATEARIQSIREKEVLDLERREKITELFATYDEIEFVEHDGKKIKASAYRKLAIKEGIDPLKVENTLMRAGLSGGVSEGPAIHVKLPVAESEIAADAIACSLLKNRFGIPASIKAHGVGEDYGYEHAFSEPVLEAADSPDVRGLSLHSMMDMTIAAVNGVGYGYRSRKSDDFLHRYVECALELKASGGQFSTLTVSNILENVANKMLLARFAMSKTTWNQIAGVKNLEDFKPAALYRLDSNLGYKPLNPQGEIEHGKLTDSKRTVQADTHAIMIGLDRRHIINDDLGAFEQIMIGLVEGAAWALEAAVYVTLLGNAGSFFDSGKNNEIDDPLGLAGLESAEIALGMQTGEGGKPIMNDPAIVLTGTSLATTAQNLYKQTTLLSVDANAGQVGQMNIYQGRYRPVVSKYLNVTTLKTPAGDAIPNQSATKWFLLPEPGPGSPVVVGLLNGRAVPTIKSAETNFNTLGMQWRGYHDFGTAQGDEEYAVMSTGDGS
jgi:hypothetical protein